MKKRFRILTLWVLVAGLAGGLWACGSKGKADDKAKDDKKTEQPAVSGGKAFAAALGEKPSIGNGFDYYDGMTDEKYYKWVMKPQDGEKAAVVNITVEATHQSLLDNVNTWEFANFDAYKKYVQPESGVMGGRKITDVTELTIGGQPVYFHRAVQEKDPNAANAYRSIEVFARKGNYVIRGNFMLNKPDSPTDAVRPLIEAVYAKMLAVDAGE